MIKSKDRGDIANAREGRERIGSTRVNVYRHLSSPPGATTPNTQLRKRSRRR